MTRYTELSEIESIILMHLKCKVSSLLLILLALVWTTITWVDIWRFDGRAWVQQCGSDVRKHNLAYRTLPHLCKSKPKWDIVMKLSEMLLRRIIVTCRCWHICHKSTDAARSTRITKLMSLEQKHPCGKSTRRTCWHTAIKHSQSTPYNYFAVGREPQTQQERAHCTKNVLLYHW